VITDFGISCTRRIQFAYGHRVMGHENKCRHLHGHNGVVLMTAVRTDCGDIAPGAVTPRADQATDHIGRVIDFAVLKAIVGGWIDAHWDHAFIYYEHDLSVLAALAAFDRHEAEPSGWSNTFALPYNPTAENMARYLLDVVCPEILKGTDVRVVEVTMWETENCFATAKEVA
jgi:6-pyruvoyltetrahydropterin/6-carboxytetrahydropterin synthase